MAIRVSLRMRLLDNFSLLNPLTNSSNVQMRLVSVILCESSIWKVSSIENRVVLLQSILSENRECLKSTRSSCHIVYPHTLIAKI